jgi:hypothetical protein
MKSGAYTLNPHSRRLAVILLWTVAIALVVAQSYALKAAAAEYRAYARGAGGLPRVPADWWRASGVAVPFILIGVALWLQRGWPSPLLQRLSKIGLLVLVPIALLGVLVALARGPAAVGSIRLPTGKQFILAVEPIPTDTVYTLYQPIGSLGLWWQQVANLDYSEDGRFTGGERIVLSPDAKWLVVARAGVWTDCFRLVDEKPLDCSITTHPNWSDAAYEADMRARSSEIQRMTGLVSPRSS